MILGTEAFARRVSEGLKGDRREQSGARALVTPLTWEQILRAVETVKGEKWDAFRDRRGDWGRDAALWVGRHLGRMHLRRLAELAGGLDYTSAGAAVSRFGRRLCHDLLVGQAVRRIRVELSNVET